MYGQTALMRKLDTAIVPPSSAKYPTSKRFQIRKHTKTKTNTRLPHALSSLERQPESDVEWGAGQPTAGFESAIEDHNNTLQPDTTSLSHHIKLNSNNASS